MSSSARWIWTPRREFVNQHLYFRKRFDLPAAPKSAVVRVTADTRFHLYVNGQSVLRGPARAYPHAMSLDELDLSPWLKAGRNVVAIHVLAFGISTGMNVFRDRAGMYLEGSVTCANGAHVELETNHSWRFHEPASYRRFVSRSATQVGFQEHFDPARDEAAADWRIAEYDDDASHAAEWHSPIILGAAGVLPWRTLQSRSIPMLETVLVRPVGLSGDWEGADLLSQASVEDQCNVMAVAVREERAPVSKSWIENPAAIASGAPLQFNPPAAGRAASTVVDFGETHYGYPTLKIEGASGGEIIDLIYDEHIGPKGVDAVSARAPNPGCDYRMSDRLICRAGANHFETIQPRGFRYVMLIVRNACRPLSVTKLAVQSVNYPAAQRGSFSCSDSRLTKIWDVGVRTLRHCMADAYMDSPRTQEMGWAATRVAGTAAFYALGDSALYRRGLKLMAQSAKHVPDGLMLGVIPSERPDSAILDYCLHWIVSLYEYFQFTGEIDILKEHLATLEKVLGFFSIHAGERGLLGPTQNYSLFLDSSPGLDRGNLSATFNLLYLQALQAATHIGKALHETGLASHCDRNAKALADRIMMVFASSRRSLLFETVDMRSGEPGDLVSQHAIALAILAGVLGKRDYDRTGPVADVLKDFLQPPGAEVAAGPVRANLFFRAYVHEAQAQLGHGQSALEDIRRTWGYMLDQGAPTWWERLPMRPGASRCHAWSVHPTTFLSRHVLGLSPIDPGWKRFRVNVHTFDLTHAEGKVPTPHGDIAIRWTLNAKTQRPDIELTVPPGTEAEFAEHDSKTVVLNAGDHQIG